MKEITSSELKKMMDSKEDFKLIDVRESEEAAQATIGGELIPMNTVLDRLNDIPKDKKVVMYCRSGTRSGIVIKTLEQQYGYTNLYNLKGGILEYSREVGI